MKRFSKHLRIKLTSSSRVAQTRDEVVSSYVYQQREQTRLCLTASSRWQQQQEAERASDAHLFQMSTGRRGAARHTEPE